MSKQEKNNFAVHQDNNNNEDDGFEMFVDSNHNENLHCNEENDSNKVITKKQTQILLEILSDDETNENKVDSTMRKAINKKRGIIRSLSYQINPLEKIDKQERECINKKIDQVLESKFILSNYQNFENFNPDNINYVSMKDIVNFAFSKTYQYSKKDVNLGTPRSIAVKKYN